jgi:hypothetical protein
MITHSIEFLYKLTFTGWISLLIPILLVGCILVFNKFIKQPIVIWILNFIVVLLFWRCCIFYNPVSWATYKKLLPLKSIDWRQYDVMKTETNKYLKPNKALKYLAVGSSQTSELYKLYVNDHSDLALFSLAGLSTLDLYTYRREIVRQHAAYVLMYLSEFDIARRPELFSGKWSPFSFHDIFELNSILDTTKYFDPGDKQIITDVLFGKFLPEYKYAFVFKELTNKILNKNELMNIIPPTQIVDSVNLGVQLKSLNELSEKYTAFNMFYLKKAMQYFNQNQVHVIIIEGQYNPLAYNSNNLLLNKKVRSLLQDLVQKYPQNSFITREEILNFKLEDYRDGYHVKEKAGLKFTEILIHKLSSTKL